MVYSRKDTIARPIHYRPHGVCGYRRRMISLYFFHARYHVHEYFLVPIVSSSRNWDPPAACSISVALRMIVPKIALCIPHALGSQRCRPLYFVPPPVYTPRVTRVHGNRFGYHPTLLVV